jgi:hypothetical protein
MKRNFHVSTLISVILLLLYSETHTHKQHIKSNRLNIIIERMKINKLNKYYSCVECVWIIELTTIALCSLIAELI